MKLYFKYFKLHFKSILQYKKSFIINLIAQIFVFFTYYFTIIALFQKFNNLKGFSVYEVFLSFAIIQIAYANVECFGRGFDKFDELIIAGEFDRILVKPRNIFLQVLGYKADPVKIMRIIQGYIILFISLFNINVDWNIFRVIAIFLMIISATVLFFGIFVITASYCFFTVQGLEVRNIFTDGGKHMAQYPIGIFKKGFVFFFTFIIPYGFVNYYPLLYVIGRNDNLYYAFSPLIIGFFLIPCILVFNIGRKHYTSCGS